MKVEAVLRYCRTSNGPAVFLVSALLMAGCGPSPAAVGNTPSLGPDANASPVAQQTAVPASGATAPSPTVAPTLATVPTPSATVEIGQDVPCLVVERRFCAAADLIHVATDRGRFTLVGLRLLPGTTVYTPVGLGGKYPVATGKSNPLSPLQGAMVSFTDPHNPTLSWTLVGDMALSRELGGCGDRPPGVTIGVITDTATLSFSRFNLVVGVGSPRDASAQTSASAEDVLRGLFPAAYSKAATEISFGAVGPGSTLITFECR